MFLIRNNDYRSKKKNGSYFVVNTDKGTYIVIDGIGSHIWEQLKKPIKESDIVSTILQEYEIDEKTATKDVGAFLKQLLKEGIIVRSRKKQID